MVVAIYSDGFCSKWLSTSLSKSEKEHFQRDKGLLESSNKTNSMVFFAVVISEQLILIYSVYIIEMTMLFIKSIYC